ncbi:MAG: maltose ABC transporter permease MalG [Corallincola sp.]|nr:maltose ABC transporter permease MalG [Corallincola sp.]
MAMVEGRGVRWRIAGSVLLLTLGSLVTLAPFLLVVLISLRPGHFIEGSLWPEQFSLEHWRAIMTWQGERPVLLWLWNSVKVSAISAALLVVLAAPPAYALARIRFRGRQKLLEWTLILQSFPSVVGLFAFYAMWLRLKEYAPGLADNGQYALILIYAGGVLGSTWLLRGYFQTLDPALEEAAIIDGANRWQIFRYVMLPLALPMLAITFVLAFVGTFGDFIMPAALIAQDHQQTLAVGLQRFRQGYHVQWGTLAAAALLAAVPAVVLFTLAQKALIRGMSAGSVKG